jgi:uncharacterized protein
MDQTSASSLQTESSAASARGVILATLRDHADELRELHVASLELFGSLVRGDADGESDVDLLVEFNRPVGIFHFVTVRERLQAILGRDVDLVERSAVLPQLRERIFEEAIRAA